MWVLFVVVNFICCSLPDPHWGSGGLERTFLSRLSNWMSKFQSLESLDNHPAFTQPQSDRLAWTLVPQYLLFCTLIPLHHPQLSSRVPSSPIEPGASISFELTENRGAALVTKHETYKMDAVVELAFQNYTKRHYESWVTFARDKKYGEDVHPILVSGFDMTKDFEMVAYSEDGSSLRAEISVDAPVVASASASLWDTRRIRCSPHTNQGPWRRGPVQREQTIELPSAQSEETEDILNDFNQCVFLRYYTMRVRGPCFMFPKVIRAGAGPHDLGSGDNEGDTFPELAVHSGADPMIIADEDSGLDTDDSDYGPDIVVHNTPSVGFSSCFFAQI